MNKYTSKTGKINKSNEKVYAFLSDFTNFKSLIPADKVSGFSATEDTCRFNIMGIGEAGLRIIEKEAIQLIKISSDGKTPFTFLFWIQLKPINDEINSTAVRLTLEADLNPMMKMMIGSHLQKGLDSMVGYMETLFNEKLKDL